MSSDKQSSLFVDGRQVAFTPGETLYTVAQRAGSAIPTLCYDERLEAFGGCRLCMVEIEGMRNPVASCTTQAAADMKVTTANAALERDRRVLLEMVASENRQIDVDPLSGYASQELSTLVDRYDARTGRFSGAISGTSRPDDTNPFILRDYENCISCYRCVRVCAEQQGDHAISVRNRGFDTQITVEFDGLLKGSSCVFCGQCVQTCPTGALGDRKALRFATLLGALAAPSPIKPSPIESSPIKPSPIKPSPIESSPIEPSSIEPSPIESSPIEKTRTICPYCGVGCSVDILTRDGQMIGVQPDMKGPANEGALCVKGQYAWDFVQHPDRLSMPLIRTEDGSFREAEWDEALDVAAAGLQAVVDQHGRHAVYGVASGRAPHEAAYTMQKFIRAGFGTNYVDNCSRA